MRIAAISDIHGNLGALDAVLADIERRGVDLIVNLGDILSGPLLPRETAARLMALDLPTIRGNHERQLLAGDREGMGLSDRYAADSITASQREWLVALPSSRWVTDDVFLCHATPDSDVACFLEDILGGELILAPLAQIEARARTCAASLIFCGHTHIPRVSHLTSGQVIVNPGSVGIQAYEGHHPIPHVVEVGSPHARYAIAERGESGWISDLIAVPYDWEAAARLADQRARPDWALALRTGFVKPALRHVAAAQPVAV
ncbi:MAG TPA: metallophosphoesterase family protein [Steroidobacteraceae bacterium]|nr:metallophosphoesterase family protein [Steroidobacteraceae bacterium]